MWRSLILIVAVGALAGCNFFAFRGSQQEIAGRLLREIPPGTSRATFLSEAQRRGWKVQGSSECNPPNPYSDCRGSREAHLVWVYLGGYDALLRTDIDSFWEFDQHDRLKRVGVRKMVDGL